MANFNSNVEVIQRRKNCPPTSSDRTVGYTVPSCTKPESIKQLEKNIWGDLVYDTLSRQLVRRYTDWTV